MREDQKLTIFVDLPNFVLRRGGEHVSYLKALLRELGGGSPRVNLRLYLSMNRWVTPDVCRWLQDIQAWEGVKVIWIDERPVRQANGRSSEPVDEALRADVRIAIARGWPIMIASHDAGFAHLLDEARRAQVSASVFGLAPGDYRRWHIGGDKEDFRHHLPQHFRALHRDQRLLWAPSRRFRLLPPCPQPTRNRRS